MGELEVKWFQDAIEDRRRRILDALWDGKVIRGEELADWLGVARRTIYRDIETLRARGYRIDGAAGFGYRLRPKKVLWPTDAPVAPVMHDRWTAGGKVWEFDGVKWVELA